MPRSRSGHRSVPVEGARAVEGMNVPGAGPVPVPVGEEARPRSRPAVAGGVVPLAVEMAVAVSVMPVAMRSVPVAVDAAGVAVVPVGARVNPVRMEVERMGMPVVSVGVPGLVVVRPGRRCGVGMGHREEGDERAEREPRGGIAAPVPVVMPPPRLGGAGNGEHGHKREHWQRCRAPLPTQPSGHAPANVRNVHHTPSGSVAPHFELPRPGVKLAPHASGPESTAGGEECRTKPSPRDPARFTTVDSSILQ